MRNKKFSWAKSQSDAETKRIRAYKKKEKEMFAPLQEVIRETASENV